MIERMSPVGTTEVQASLVWIIALKTESMSTIRLPIRCGADQGIAEEIDQAGDRGEYSQDHADHQKPGGEIRPHHLSRRVVHDVRHQSADEAHDGERHQHGMDWMPGDSRGRGNSFGIGRHNWPLFFRFFLAEFSRGFSGSLTEPLQPTSSGDDGSYSWGATLVSGRYRWVGGRFLHLPGR